MKRKGPIYNYQVSFAKSLDISKDYKKKALNFKKKESTIKIKINVEKFFRNEDYLTSLLLPFDLESSLVSPFLRIFFSNLEETNINVFIIFVKYTNNSFDFYIKGPSFKMLFKYYLNNIEEKNFVIKSIMRSCKIKTLFSNYLIFLKFKTYFLNNLGGYKSFYFNS